MEYSREDLKKVQKIEMQILEEVIRVCDENGITYFTIGGTTLGVIRHKDFIPWDDDIDIGMLRSDYEKFLRIAPYKLKQGYILQHFYREKEVPTYFAKVRKDNTRFVESCVQDINIHQGIFIDVMPFDYIPNNTIFRRFYKVLAFLWGQIYIAKSMCTTCATTDSKKILIGGFIRRILHLILIPVPKEVIFNYYDKMLRKYEKQKTSWVSSRGYSCFECKETDLIPPKKAEFGELKVCVPADADKVLRIQYGDYMKIPPIEKQISHRPVELKFE